MTHTKTLLLLFGGESSEHDISILTARNIAAALDHTKYDVLYGYVSKSGTQWKMVQSIDDIERGDEMTPVLGGAAFMVAGKKVVVDVIFPVFHGKNGEDGSVQGLLELLHVPYVGPSVEAAAVTMNKQMTKELLMAAELPIVPYLYWHTHQPKPDYNDSLTKLSSDVVFVKPNKAGSSVGVCRVTNVLEWDAALDQAAQHDSTVLIEKAIDAREIELAVLGTHTPKVTVPGEIISHESFYSFDDKYADSSTASISIPAKLEEKTTRVLQTAAIKAYQAVGGSGMSRVDFFMDRKDGQIYLNEINSIPGFTDISMYPKLWQHEGLSYSALLDELILDALSRE